MAGIETDFNVHRRDAGHAAGTATVHPVTGIGHNRPVSIKTHAGRIVYQDRWMTLRC